MKSPFEDSNHIAFSRSDRSVLGVWWWTIDRWALLAIILLMVMGGLLVMSAGLSVAGRLDIDSFHFSRRQLVFLMMAVLCIVGFSSQAGKKCPFAGRTGTQRGCCDQVDTSCYRTIINIIDDRHSHMRSRHRRPFGKHIILFAIAFTG